MARRANDTSGGLQAERAQTALFDALKSGALRSGQFISMPQLVERLRFPIASVRDAVKNASSLGLLETLPKRGIQVMEASPGMTRTCLEFRTMLDQEGARRRIASGQMSGLAELREAHRALLSLAQRAESGPLSEQAIETDLTLHDFLAAGLGNRLAEDSYRVNRIRIAVIQNSRPFVRNRIVSAMQEHLAIMEALEAADAPAATAAIWTHFEKTLEWWGVA